MSLSTQHPQGVMVVAVFLCCTYRHGYWVYDFALPMLLLHALKFRTAESLKHW
jgi:hypothetical protein